MKAFAITQNSSVKQSLEREELVLRTKPQIVQAKMCIKKTQSFVREQLKIQQTGAQGSGCVQDAYITVITKKTMPRVFKCEHSNIREICYRLGSE